MDSQLDFYSGFEGEPEITFRTLDHSASIRLWAGYFDRIIESDVPVANGYWAGLALIYHTTTGWYTESPFPLSGLDEIIDRLRLCSTAQWNEPVREVYQALLGFFEEAQRQGVAVLAEYS